MIRRRPTYEELIGLDTLPPWLQSVSLPAFMSSLEGDFGERRPIEAARDRRARSAADGLRALSALAGRVLLVERAWPPLVWALAVAALFLAALMVRRLACRAARHAHRRRRPVRAGALAALAPLVRLRWPRARDITARLDRDAGADHRPATSLADSLANDQDPVARALWAEHQARLARAVEAIRVAPPAPAHGRARPLRAALRRGAARLRRAVAAGPSFTTASPPPSTGAAAAPSPRRREAASTPGSTLRPMRAARRSSSTSRAPIRRQ